MSDIGIVTAARHASAEGEDALSSDLGAASLDGPGEVFGDVFEGFGLAM